MKENLQCIFSHTYVNLQPKFTFKFKYLSNSTAVSRLNFYNSSGQI